MILFVIVIKAKTIKFSNPADKALLTVMEEPVSGDPDKPNYGLTRLGSMQVEAELTKMLIFEFCNCPESQCGPHRI